MLEAHDLSALGWQSAEHVHLFAEAARRAYADRNQVLADPDFVDVPLAEMISKDYAAERGADISLDGPPPRPRWAGARGGESLETTHYSVVDRPGTRWRSPPPSTPRSGAR
jgi:gamma-glutamyltranspeptidase / glutathione hydrolase